jgi:GntR family transcriptional repressor for pyruvate dehydrogenase complex
MTSLGGGLHTPLVSPSRVDEITDRLVTAIAIGEYLPGARLPSERDLAASLKVARTTVRAAIAAVVELGLLETQRGRGGGSFVRGTWPAASAGAVQRTLAGKWEALRDASEAISMIHGTVARAAAENRMEEDVVLLRERLELFRDAESGLASQKADEQLHLAIVNAARNETLKNLLFDLESQVSIAAPAHPWGGPEGMREMELRSLRDHVNLVEAICDSRADDAANIAREHVKIDFELLEDALRRSGIDR